MYGLDLSEVAAIEWILNSGVDLGRSRQRNPLYILASMY